MIVCFGASWPFSIARSWRARTTAGKSIIFLWLVLLGYAAGVIHKMLHSRDGVIVFYVINGLMVVVDIAIYYRNYALVKVRPA